jgi:hypothetical protein
MRVTNKEHSKKLHRLVLQSMAVWPHKNAKIKRRLYVEMELAPKPSREQQEQIDIHLKAMSMLRSNQGTDSTSLERYHYLNIERYHMEEIKQIHEDYYWSINIQTD